MCFGIIMMLTAVYQSPMPQQVVADVKSEEQAKVTMMAYVIRRETLFLWGLVVTFISMMTFKGIRTDQHRLLTPTILLQYFQLTMTIIQTVLTILYWTMIADNVRGYLSQMVTQVEYDIKQDPTFDDDSLEQWNDFETLVKNDNAWSDLSPKILYVITMWHALQMMATA